MKAPDLPLIIGAGPVGLAAALFLERAGTPVRIVDRASFGSRESRALAVNPRTLEILEPTGVTARMLEEGLVIRGVRFATAKRTVAEIRFQNVEHRFPFMLALSQSTTEHLLQSALEACGGRIEREVELIGCEQDHHGVHATLMRHGGIETVRCPWLVAADGAHSTVRDQLDLRFPGTTMERPWHLADMALETKLESDLAHVFLLEGGGFLFLIRVVHGAKGAEGPPIWRLISNRADPARWLVHAKQAGVPLWTSEFHVAHRICSQFQSGRVYLAGDAAHVHSPVGARGMNLGIEDAYVLSNCLMRPEGCEYENLRREPVEHVVRRVEMLSHIATGESGAARFMRSMVLGGLVRIPAVRRQMLQTVTGLDHPLTVGEETREPAAHEGVLPIVRG
jgi:2-polyprenyl-6-methoxyphenol hydroxylase-like FAD-dependent oxidoreductase